MAIANTHSKLHAHRVGRVLWVVFILNLIVAAAKFVYGFVTESTAMQADGIHSIFDSIGNIVGLVAIGLAGRPADERHPYGHSKFETYGSLIIGLLLLFAAFQIGSDAVRKLIRQDFNARVTAYSFVVMVVTLLINLGVTIFERLQGKKLSSEILKADAFHTFSDAIVSIGVIIGLALVTLGYPAADPILALVVTVAILASALSVFRAAFKTLSDTSRVPYQEIARSVEGIDGIVNVHHVRTRGTESEVYCDIHIVVDPEMTVACAHSLGDRAESLITEAFPEIKEVLIHIEPLGFQEEGETSIIGQENEHLTPTQEEWLLTEQGRKFLTPHWISDLKREQVRDSSKDSREK